MTKYRTDQLRDGSKTFTTTDPNGLKTTTSDGTNGTATSTAPSGMQAPTEQKPDPRYGMQSPLSNLTVKTPAGLQSNVNQFRKVTQMSGSQVSGLTDSVVVNGKSIKTEWDGIRRLLTQTSPEGRKTFTFFNQKGKVVKDSISGLAPVTYNYDSKGRRTEANEGCRRTSFVYDAFGRQASVVDPYDRSTMLFYDAADRLVRILASDSSEVLFVYDRCGNITSIRPPSKPEHVYEYSLVNSETTYIPPYTGDSVRATVRTYSLDRELMRVLRPDSLNMTMEYDSFSSMTGQPKRIYFDRGVVTNLFDTTKGVQKGVVGANGDTVVYQYDGRMLKMVNWKGNVRGAVAFSYNSDMLISTETVVPAVGSSDSVNLKYDRDGLLASAGALRLHSGTANALLLTDTLGGVITIYSYTANGELSLKESKFGATTIFKSEYVRDSLGRITIKYETDQNESRSFTYRYDQQGRLNEIWSQDTMISMYTYDENGNRLVHWNRSAVDSGSYDAQDRAILYGPASFSYSRTGDLRVKVVGFDTTKYFFDALGNLVSVFLPSGSLIEYSIDGNGLRIGRKMNGSTTHKWLYSNNLKIVAELDSSNRITARYVYAMGKNTPEYVVKSGVTYRIITDQLGSVRRVVNVQTGVIAQRVDYDEFGNTTFDSNPGFTPFGFAGGLLDIDTKLEKFGARDYDPGCGRWLTKDPLRFQSKVTNFYSYALNDPVNNSDPEGTSVSPAEAAVVAGLSMLNYITTILDIIDDANSKNYGALSMDLALHSLSAYSVGASSAMLAGSINRKETGLDEDPFAEISIVSGVSKETTDLVKAFTAGVGLALAARGYGAPLLRTTVQTAMLISVLYYSGKVIANEYRKNWPDYSR